MPPAVKETNEPEHDLSWSPDAVFAGPQLGSVPEEPGLLVLVCGGSGGAVGPAVVWVEAPDNLRLRARELGGYATVGPELGALLLRPDLRFRYAVVKDDGVRGVVLERLRERVVTLT